VLPRFAALVDRAKARLPAIPDPWLRASRTVSAIVLETIRGFRADRGIDLAASLAFTTLLSAVPLLATLSVFIAAVFHENDAQFLDLFNSILPYHSEILTESLRSFVAESTALSGIGLAVLIVASVRLIFVVEELFNAVWGAPRRRAWLQRIGLYVLVLLGLALLIGSIGVGLRSRSSTSSYPLVGGAYPFLIELLALTLLYRYLPNAHVHWRSAVTAGIAVALLLELLRKAFGLYVDALSRMNLITGSLSLALLVLFSIYFVWVLILLGVEFTHVLQENTRRGRRISGPRAGRAENAIRMLLRLAAGGSLPFQELYAQQEASSVEAEELLAQLRGRGLVRGDRASGFLLAARPEEITVARVVEAISPDLYTITPEEEDQVVKVLAPLFERLDAERRALLGATLADLRGA
jgi:membrane protein